MKRLLLGTAALMMGVASMNAQIVKDPATYTPVDGYELRSLWIKSELTNNNIAAALGEARGMAALNGELLFCRRDGDPIISSIDVYNGSTGAFKRNLVLASNIFTKADGSQVTLPCNDIQVDDAGHVLVSNLCTDLKQGNFQIWSINLSDGSGTKILDSLIPELSGTSRIDAFGVYGDVTRDGYLMAAIVGSETGAGDQVLRWDITGGVVAAEPIGISIQSYYPETPGFNGTAPRVCPVDNDLFYLDGFNSAATLYDMNGVMVDGFANALDCAPKNFGNNGVDEFSINGKDFVTYVYSNNVVTPAQAWNVCELGEGMQFSGMKQYFQYPAAGLGTASNAVRTALPRIEVNEAKTIATLYVYAYKSGVAAYQFGLSKDLGPATGIEQTKSDAALIVTTTASGIKLSQSANIEVFNFAGQKVAAKENANEAALAPGLYIVKAITAEGAVVTTKVVVK